jgi:hypothetical protein
MAFVTELVRLAHSDLLMPMRLWSREEILATPTMVPAAAGVYAWYFERLPHGVPTADFVTFGGIGISPRAPTTSFGVATVAAAKCTAKASPAFGRSYRQDLKRP